MALAIDVSIGATQVAGGGATAFSTGAFSTAQANEVLVALVAVTDNAAAGDTLTTTVTGAGLSWTLAIRKNVAAYNEVAEIWYAVASGVLTGVTVTTTPAGMLSSVKQSVALHVLSFTGANTGSPIGATGSQSAVNGTGGTPSITLSTSGGSYCVAAGADYWNNASIVVGSGQTLLTDNHDTTNGEEEWTQRTTSTTGGSQTMNCTNSFGTDGWVFVAAEILAAGAAFTWQQLVADQYPADYLYRPDVIGY